MSLPLQTSRVPSYIFIGLVLLLTTNMRLVSAGPIVLYEDAHFKGKSSRFQIGKPTCINLIGKLNDFYSSVDTVETCLELCEHQNCGGKCKQVKGRIEDLSDIFLNDQVSSIKGCGLENIATLPGERSKKSKDGKSLPLSPSPPMGEYPISSPSPHVRTRKMVKKKRKPPLNPTTAKLEVAAIHHQPISRDEPEPFSTTSLTTQSRTETANKNKTSTTTPHYLITERRNISDHNSSNDDGSKSRSNNNKNIINKSSPNLLEENPSLERIQQSSYRHRRKRRKLINYPGEK